MLAFIRARRSGIGSGSEGGPTAFEHQHFGAAITVRRHQIRAPLSNGKRRLLGCEAQTLDTTYRNLEEELATGTPAVIRVSPSQFVAALEVRRGRVYLFTPAP